MNFFESKRISSTMVYLAGLTGILTLMSSLSCARDAEDSGASSLQWIPWSQEVVAQAQKADKLILIDVYADWCGPCKMMDDITYQNPAVLKKLEDFITVKVNSDTDHEAAARFSTGSIPTTVILTADGDPILTESGYFPPDRFLGLLNSVEGMLADLKNRRQQAPELDVDEWINGQSTTLKQLKGKVVLLDIFQIICPGCHAAHPQIVKFREQYQKQGLEVLGIAVAFEYQSSQKPDRIKQYVQDKGYPYPVAIDRDMTATFRKYQSGGTPWTVLIDRSGNIRYLGFFRGAEIEAKIQTLLAEGANGRE